MPTALLAFVYGVPSLIFSNSLFYDPYYIRKLLIALPAAGLLLYCLFHGLRGYKRGIALNSFLSVPTWCFFAYIVVYGFLSRTSYADTLEGIFSVGLMFAIYVSFMSLDIRLKPILAAANVAASLHVVIAHLQYYGFSKGIPWIMPVELFRGYGVIGNIGYRGLLAILVTLCVFNAIYLAMDTSNWRNRIFNAITAAVFVASLASIGGRTALISFAAALVPWGVRYRARIFGIMAAHRKILAVFGIAVFLVSALFWRDVDVIRRLTLIGRDQSSMLRLSHYATSLCMIAKNPVFGVGIGNYKYHYLEAQKTMKENFPGASRFPWTYTYWAHNEYLQFAAEFGILAFILLLSFALFRANRVIKRVLGNSVPETLWAVSILIVFAISSLFERPFHQVEIFIWFPVACAIIDKAGGIKLENTSFSIARIVIAVSLTLVALILFIDGAVGQNALRRAYDAPDLETASIFLEKAKSPLITRDEAAVLRNDIDIAYCVKTGNRKCLDAALDTAYDFFERYPTNETYVTIRNNAIRYNRIDLFKKLNPILPSKPIG